MRARRLAGRQVGAHPHLPRPVPARDRLQVRPIVGRRAATFQRQRLLNAQMRQEAMLLLAAAAQGAGGQRQRAAGPLLATGIQITLLIMI